MADVTSANRPAKRWFGMRPWFVILLLCAAIGAMFLTSHRVRAIAGISDAAGLTTNLPDVARIEIELVHVNFETIDKVLDTKILVGPETEQLVKLWRSQSYSFDGHVMCHAPLYRIRFYKNNTLLTEATVCFHCHNIYFYKRASAEETEEPLDATFSFNGDDEAYKQLRAYLSSLFPRHDVEAESVRKASDPSGK